MWFKEAVDHGLKVDEGPEDAALETAFGQDGEEAFDRVELGGGRRGEVEHPARMTRQPCPHGGVFVGGVVVENDLDELTDRDLPLDGVEEADELLMAVTLHVLSDDRAVEHVHGGEQRRRAVADVVGSWFRRGPS